MTDNGPLADRRTTLERLARDPVDLLVVGGGIVGAGILLDATSRGMSAALVEQDDIASGTSGRSRASSTAACATSPSCGSGSSASRSTSAPASSGSRRTS